MESQSTLLAHGYDTQSELAGRVELPYFNSKLPDYQKIPILLYSKAVAEVSYEPRLNIQQDSMEADIDLTYDIHRSYTMVTQIPPQPNRPGGLKRGTWIAITVVCVIGMTILSSISVARFYLKWHRNKQKEQAE